MRRVFKRRNLALLALFVLLMGAIYGFAASNTVPTSAAGDGQATISGYDITNVTYNLDNADPGKISSVEFDIAAQDTNASPPSEVKIKLVAASTTWFPCTDTAGHVSCTVGGSVTVLAADQLRIVAVQ